MTPLNALDAFVCGYAPSVRAKKVIVIVKPLSPAEHVAYVDESGGGDGRVLLLAACVHTYIAWAEFSKDWVTALEYPPKISAFHMREARKRVGDFAGWKAIDVDHKVIALTEVIVHHQPHVVSCWVSENDYNELIRGMGPYDVRHAYFSCFCATVIKVAEYQAALGITTPADYVFDEKGDIGYEALIWYPAMKQYAPADIRPFMGSTPTFKTDEEILPLQAADLIAWHKRRKKEGRSLDPEIAASMRVDELPGAEVNISREVLEDMAHKLSKVPHVKEFREGPSIYKQFKSAVRKGKRRD